MQDTISYFFFSTHIYFARSQGRAKREISNIKKYEYKGREREREEKA